MSVRARIVRTDDIYVENKKKIVDKTHPNAVKYTHEDLKEVINITHQGKLIETMCHYGAEDFTNQDYIGEIEMGKDAFDSMIEQESFVGDDSDSVDELKEYFEDNDWLILRCY